MIKMKLAYLTTTYPAVSHTFIRREILEIERRGHSVLRLALRKFSGELVDPVDRDEQKRTYYCLGFSFMYYAIVVLKTILKYPCKFISALVLTFELGKKSDRGVLKNIAYLIEACTFLWVIKKNEIRHIHVHFGTNPTAVAWLIKKLGGPGYSFTVHGPAEFDAVYGFDLAGKIMESEFVVAISDYCSAQLRRCISPGVWDKIKVIRCTVDQNFFNAFVPAGENSHTFVCVGRLSAQKGQIILVDAFAELYKKRKDAKLIFVGDGEYRFLIEKRIEEHNLNNSVLITGYLSEKGVREQIVKGTVLVLPSFAEGLPMVLMESFAIGRPVISTYIAGIPELVVNGKNGWLVPAGNQERLYEALENACICTKDKLRQMAEFGRQLTLERHSIETEIDKLESLFLDIDTRYEKRKD